MVLRGIKVIGKPRLTIGDKVKVSDDLTKIRYMTQDQLKLRNKEFKVEDFMLIQGRWYYILEGVSGPWHAEALTLSKSKNFTIVIDVLEDKSKVLATKYDESGLLIEQKSAFCHPDDEFDPYIGADLALKRLFGVEEDKKVTSAVTEKNDVINDVMLEGKKTIDDIIAGKDSELQAQCERDLAKILDSLDKYKFDNGCIYFSVGDDY